MKIVTKENITIDDIARLANVSKTTVSRYINGKFEFMSNETRLKIESIINEYNYIPSNVARSLKTKTTKLIAFIVADIENAFAAPTIKAMNQSLLDTKYHMIVSTANDSVEQEKKLIESLIEQRVDAIMLNPVDYDSPYLKDLKLQVPLILVDRKVKDLNTDYVGTNSIKAMHDAVDHLRLQGFTDIHIITEKYESVEPRFRRVQGYKDMMYPIGYNDEKLDNEYIHVVETSNKPQIESVIRKIRRKSTMGTPAIICTNGKVSLAVVIAIKNLRIRMPYELGLVIYDDFGTNNVLGWTDLQEPSVTRLSPNWYETGIKAVELVQKRVLKPTGSKKDIKIDVELTQNDSTKLIKLL